jgi:hypothetical protein
MPLALTFFKKANRKVQFAVFATFTTLIGIFGLRVTQTLAVGKTVSQDFTLPGSFTIVGSEKALVARMVSLSGLTSSLVDLRRVEFTADEPGDWFRREIEEATVCIRNIVAMTLEDLDFGAPAAVSHCDGPVGSADAVQRAECSSGVFRYGND